MIGYIERSWHHQKSVPHDMQRSVCNQCFFLLQKRLIPAGTSNAVSGLAVWLAPMAAVPAVCAPKGVPAMETTQHLVQFAVQTVSTTMTSVSYRGPHAIPILISPRSSPGNAVRASCYTIYSLFLLASCLINIAKDPFRPGSLRGFIKRHFRVLKPK